MPEMTDLSAPRNIGKKAGDIASNLGNKAKNLGKNMMQKGKNMMGKLGFKTTEVNIILYILIAMIVIGMASYITTTLSKKQMNRERMKNTLNDIYPTKIGNINVADSQFKHDLRDYYVKSSYNSCCAGNFKNDFVDLCPLKSVIKQGCRLLDFEIYSVNKKAVVASSAANSFNYKESYNSVDFDKVMDTVSRYAFAGSTAPNASDPLFLHFRIMSKHPYVCDQMAKSIKRNLGDRLMGSEYGNEYQGENLGAVPLKKFMGKCVIICDKQNDLFEKTSLDKLVNIASGSQMMRELTNFQVVYTHNYSELINYNKKHMTISTPDLKADADNVPVNVHQKYGVQFTCMNFQTNDSNLQYYEKFFNDRGYAFILKPKNLRFIPLTIKKPKKQNPELSFGPRKIEKPYFKVNM